MAAAALALVVVTGCVADPPPPTVVGEERAQGETADLSAGGVLLALDRMDDGFNPHLLADQGVDTDLVAALLLPSAFVPGPDGELVLNDALLSSAAPLPDDPHTIRYTIDQRAQWSDGVPVGAEDFEYLWRQMTSQPGVVDPAEYERIEAVRAGAGGKVVDVVFDSPPLHWESLFADLLPGHILKDAPDGFHGAMAHLPVMSAGPYMVRAADTGRGEIEFVPNDRYWAETTALEQIVVRRATGTGQLGATLRGGPGSMAMVGATQAATDVATTVPDVVSEEVHGAVQLELGFNVVAPAVSDVAVRRALVASISPELVGRIVTGESDPSVTRYPFPDHSGGDETPGGAAEVERMLTREGFVRSGPRWERDGTPLSVTIGVEAKDERAITAAYTVADQLRTAGVGARVWELDESALYADALPHGLVDAVVGWQRVDGNPDVAAVSRFACAQATSEDEVAGDFVPDVAKTTDSTRPVRPPTTVTTLVSPEPDVGRTEATTSADATPTATPDPRRSIGATAPARTSGVYGVCDPALDKVLGLAPDAVPEEGAANEQTRTEVNLAAAGDLVAEMALRVPLVRPSFLLAADSVETPWGAAAQTVGPEPRIVSDVFDTASDWRRTR